MIERGVLDEITQADAAARHSFVIEWRTSPDSSLFEGVATKRERFDVVRRYYESLKGPLIAELKQAGFAVNDLAASPQVIVTGSGEQWLSLTRNDGVLASSAAIRVLPNVTFTSAAIAR